MEAFTGLKEVFGSLTIGYNQNLVNLLGLDSLEMVEKKFILTYCLSLEDISALRNLTRVNSDLYFFYNPTLDNIIGLESLQSVGGDFVFVAFPNLLSIEPFSTLSNIGKDFIFTSNLHLPSIHGFENLTSIGGVLEVYGNNNITSLAPLKNIDYTTIDSIVIQRNESLSECAIESICNYLSNGGVGAFDHNLYGCNSENHILDACTVGTEDAHKAPSFTLFPNPAHDYFYFDYLLPSGIPATARLYNVQGQLVKERALKAGNVSQGWNVQDLVSGVYFFVVEAASGVLFREKVVVY